jgi:negative regulator of flagellin synthesis FlgM
MKIENLLKPVGPTTVADSGGKSKANGNGAKSVESGSEKVNLSPMSNQAKQAEASLKDVPVVDKARVEEIKQAIAEGKFKVNAEVVADKLIDTVKELLSSRKA